MKGSESGTELKKRAFSGQNTGVFGAFWGVFGAFWGRFGAFWGVFGRFGAFFERVQKCKICAKFVDWGFTPCFKALKSGDRIFPGLLDSPHREGPTKV